MTRTEETMKMQRDTDEAARRTLKVIEIESLTDDGEWISRCFANEAAAQEQETKWKKQGVEYRRTGR